VVGVAAEMQPAALTLAALLPSRLLRDALLHQRGNVAPSAARRALRQFVSANACHEKIIGSSDNRNRNAQATIV